MDKSFPSQKSTVRVRNTPFQHEHLVQYGLKIMQRDTVSSHVTSVRCQFCIFTGKEDTIGDKRKHSQTKRVKDWTSFRPELYESHHKSQHETHWVEYQRLDYEAKKVYFDQKIQFKDTLHGHFGQSKKVDIIEYIPASIVTKIIGEMFFHTDDHDGPSQTAVLNLFKPEDDTMHSFTIKNHKQFHLIVRWLSRGISFAQAEDLLADTKEVLGASELGSITVNGVSNYARGVFAINLSRLSTILNDNATWAFSLANDASTHYGKSYLDNRIRIYRGGILYNIHVLAIPMFEHHSGENMFKLVSKVFDVLCPTWRTKLISMGSDGASAMTGEYSGVVTRIEKEVNHYSILLIIDSTSPLSYLMWYSSAGPRCTTCI